MNNHFTEIVKYYYREAGMDILRRAVASMHCTTLRRVILSPNAIPIHAQNCSTTFITGRLTPTQATPSGGCMLLLGAGKSVVMQTLCQRLQEAGRFGGSFFFKRGHMTCSNAKVLFVTLAYQLALNRHELMGAIEQSIEKDLLVLGRAMGLVLRSDSPPAETPEGTASSTQATGLVLNTPISGVEEGDIQGNDGSATEEIRSPQTQEGEFTVSETGDMIIFATTRFKMAL
ncbi:hypothetical protein B0H14DRAFT_2884492 [Mycena olivaceomarginata]|nr:hypothetical protein B0H14DRAFT_2884492 [Mycena olivaceomarginata]